jgi:rhamnose utilization protein RhaD (predicted bifunctional aldolase and dehydrogenase)/NAD(P)-dependent dehydrogenase (short-subunit alcohol dehydrogenase family)
MNNLWNEKDAERCQSDLDLLVYSSRLLGSEPKLVLHGGGNTSVKLTHPNLFGDPESVLHIKASGHDLATIDGFGFVPLRLEGISRLLELEEIDDRPLVDALRMQTLDSRAPNASVESLLHTIFPEKYVAHTHSDAILSITNTKNGFERVGEVFGNSVAIVPYVRPGFGLAKRSAEIFSKERTAEAIGLVLMNHGLFTFGDSARQAYDSMIDLVSQAEDYLQQQGAVPVYDVIDESQPIDGVEIAQLRKDISDRAGFPLVLGVHQNRKTLNFSGRVDVERISQIGPATPDHVIFTRPKPQLGTDVAAYVEAYEKYYSASAEKCPSVTITEMLDPAPRVILDKRWGMVTAGQTAQEAAIAADIYMGAIDVILAAESLGGFCPLPDEEIFPFEYWGLEQAKIKRDRESQSFKGETVLVTGAASGIGKACMEAFFRRGAAVIGADINPDIKSMCDRQDFLGIESDLTDENAISRIFHEAAMAFGSVDMLVLNAGIFPKARRIEEMTNDYWQKVMRINLDANMTLMREAHPYLCRAPRGGRIAVIGSKNVPAPGPGAAAYSASKAAMNQLARVAALEWSKDNIRINSLHPNAVFDTGLWTDEVLQARAEHYGMTVEAYKKNNLLKTEVTSRDVAELAAELCGQLFAKVQCAQIPIDGGNERVV